MKHRNIDRGHEIHDDKKNQLKKKSDHGRIRFKGIINEVLEGKKNEPEHYDPNSDDPLVRLDYWFKMAEISLDLNSLKTLKFLIDDAKETGIVVDSAEERLDDIKKRIYIYQIRKSFVIFKNKHDQMSFYSMILMMSRASEEGIDIRMWIRALKRELIRSFLSVSPHLKSRYSVYLTSEFAIVEEAKSRGIDLSQIESLLLDLRGALYRNDVENVFRNILVDCKKSDFVLLKKKIMKAKEIGVDVEDIEGEIPNLEKACI